MERLTSKQLRRVKRLAEVQARQQVGRDASKGRAQLTHPDLLWLHEDERFLLRANALQYQQAVSQGEAFFRIMLLYQSAGVPEEVLRSMVVAEYMPQEELYKDVTVMDRSIEMFKELPSDVQQRIRERMPLIMIQFNLRNRSRVFYRDEDDMLLVQKLQEEQEEKPLVLDLLKENLRARREALALLEMQIGFLTEQQKAERKKQRQPQRKKIIKSKSTTIEVFEQTEPPLEIVPDEIVADEVIINEPQTVSKPFIPGWQIYWTKVRFSRASNHQILLPTRSREDFVEAIAPFRSEGGFSIKPTSIASAIEFHLRRDVLQRVLAARLRYGPPEIKEWIKIKRGDDRIFLLLSQESPNTLIFFAGNRDTVYRGF